MRVPIWLKRRKDLFSFYRIRNFDFYSDRNDALEIESEFSKSSEDENFAFDEPFVARIGGFLPRRAQSLRVADENFERLFQFIGGVFPKIELLAVFFDFNIYAVNLKIVKRNKVNRSALPENGYFAADFEFYAQSRNVREFGIFHLDRYFWIVVDFRINFIGDDDFFFINLVAANFIRQILCEKWGRQ